MTTDRPDNQVQMKKKRGPKKKVWSPQVKLQRQQARRSRANARERQRMHGLNDSLEILRDACPLFANQRLSKIDTLRLARNYIKALTDILEKGKEPDVLEYARTLTKDLSQGTINMIAGHLQVSPHLLWYNENIFYHQTFVHNNYSPPLSFFPSLAPTFRNDICGYPPEASQDTGVFPRDPGNVATQSYANHDGTVGLSSYDPCMHIEPNATYSTPAWKSGA